MGTRCNIGFFEPGETNYNEFQALIYRHFDGYPEGVIPDIMPILQDFDKNRGMGDLEYASAWLVAKLKDDYLNIGICRNYHGDIEYFYAIYPDCVKVYAIDWQKRWDGVDINKCLRFIQTLSIKDWTPETKIKES